MPTSLGSYLFSIVLVASLSRYGTKAVSIFLFLVQNGHIKRLTDQDIQSSVLEIMGTNITTAYITCPAAQK